MSSRREFILDALQDTWFGEQPYTLRDFYWDEKNYSGRDIIVEYLKEWGEWKLASNRYIQARMLGERVSKPELPAPFLFINGGAGIGKTEVLTRGLGRFVALNMQFFPLLYIHWPTYIYNSFNDKDGSEDNWDAQFLIIDDMDGWKPQQKSGSTYILQLIMNRIKQRTMPTVIVTNRKLEDIRNFMSKDINGIINKEALAFAMIIQDNLVRKAYDDRQVSLADNSVSTSVKRNAELREKARKMSHSEFLFPQELGWVPEVWW
jgi:hypothetical protein